MWLIEVYIVHIHKRFIFQIQGQEGGPSTPPPGEGGPIHSRHGSRETSSPVPRPWNMMTSQHDVITACHAMTSRQEKKWLIFMNGQLLAFAQNYLICKQFLIAHKDTHISFQWNTLIQHKSLSFISVHYLHTCVYTPYCSHKTVYMRILIAGNWNSFMYTLRSLYRLLF